MSGLSATTTQLCYDTGGASNDYFYLVEIDIPGTYEDDTVPTELIVDTDGPDPYNVEIRFKDDTDQISTSGTTSMAVEFWLDTLPWGAAEPTHISIDVDIRDEADAVISGGGVLNQGQAYGVARPDDSKALKHRENGTVHQIWASGKRETITPAHAH